MEAKVVISAFALSLFDIFSCTFVCHLDHLVSVERVRVRQHAYHRSFTKCELIKAARIAFLILVAYTKSLTLSIAGL